MLIVALYADGVQNTCVYDTELHQRRDRGFAILQDATADRRESRPPSLCEQR